MSTQWRLYRSFPKRIGRWIVRVLFLGPFFMCPDSFSQYHFEFISATTERENCNCIRVELFIKNLRTSRRDSCSYSSWQKIASARAVRNCKTWGGASLAWQDSRGSKPPRSGIVALEADSKSTAITHRIWWCWIPSSYFRRSKGLLW